MPKWQAYACASACALALGFSPAARADVLEISSSGDAAWVSRTTPPPVVAHTESAAALTPQITAAGAGAALNPRLIEAVAWAESRFQPEARSPAGAIGVMQLMPATAAALGVDANDPAQNIRGGAAYLRQMLDAFGGDLTLALAAYNAGPDAVRRYGGVPPFRETQNYVAAVLGYLASTAEEATP